MEPASKSHRAEQLWSVEQCPFTFSDSSADPKAFRLVRDDVSGMLFLENGFKKKLEARVDDGGFVCCQFCFTRIDEHAARRHVIQRAKFDADRPLLDPTAELRQAFHEAQAMPRASKDSLLVEKLGPIPWAASSDRWAASLDPIQLVKKYLERLGTLRGEATNKSSLPHMAVVGVAGQGKTTLLKLLQLELDSDLRSEASKPLPAVDGVSSWIVVVATCTKKDAARGPICATTAARWLNDFVGHEVPWPHPDALNFELAAEMLRARRGLPAKQVGLVLCIDDLANIGDADTETLLNRLACFQQSQVSAGLATAFIVPSSLESRLETVSGSVLTKYSGHYASPIALPPLNVDAFLELVHQNINLNGAQWLGLRGVAHLSAGNGRLLQEMYEAVADDRMTDGVFSYILEHCRRQVTFGSDKDFVDFWKLMAKRLRDPHAPLVFSAAGDTEMIDSLAATRSIVWHLSAAGGIVVDPVPLALLQYPRFTSTMEAMGLPERLYQSIVNAIKILKDALHCSPEEKRWEAGIIAAMALRSAAAISEDPTTVPTLATILPLATFSDDALKGWVMDVRDRNAFKSFHDLNTSEKRRPSRDVTALLVSAELPNQKAVEGCVYLRDKKGGNEVTLVTQMKLWAETRPSNAEEALVKIAKLMKGEDSARWAALYCATGTTAKFRVPAAIAEQGMRYIVLESDGALQLLSSLGHTRLVYRISDIHSKRRSGAAA